VTGQTHQRDANAPIVVDLGKRRRKLIRLLRRGEGPLMDDVKVCVEELRSAGTIGATAQPVIVVVSPKRRKRPGLFGAL